MWDCAVTMCRVWPVRSGEYAGVIMRVLGGGVLTGLGEVQKLQSQEVP